MKRKKNHYKVFIDWSDEDQCYIARIPELPGCVADGKSYVTAAENLEQVLTAYLFTLSDIGKPIPDPLNHRKFSGKFPVRVSPQTHSDATARAMLEGISLNQFVERALKKVI